MFIREKILQNRILEDKNLRIRGDVATQLNCLYRNINIYTYMAYLDVDEVLNVPFNPNLFVTRV